MKARPARTTTTRRRGSAPRRLLPLLLLAAIAGALLVPAAAFGATASSGWYQLKKGQLSYPGFTDLAFVNAMRGWAVGADGTIAMTADGGVTWRSQNSGITADLSAVAFSDAAHGWAVCEFGILGTTDGGATWNVSKSTTDEYELRDIACTDALHAWAVGTDKAAYAAAILSTADGGATWQARGVSDVGPHPYNGLYGVTFVDGNHGWAVGEGGTIVATADGGGIWTTQRDSLAATQPRLAAAYFVDVLHGWAVGNSGTILFTTDGGAAWVRQDSWTTTTFDEVCFTDASHGWAVGFGGIFATSNGGANWRAEPLSFYVGPLQGIAFADARRGWAVSCWGDVIVTYSAGVPDTRGPITYARAASGRRGRIITLKFKVVDNYSPSATAIKIVIKSGKKRVKTYIVATAKTGVWYAVKWRPKARGTYRYYVYAKDLAGNSQSRVGSAAVTVR